MPQFLSFRTIDGPEAAKWSATATALLRALASALQARGFAANFEAGKEDPDWTFVASRESESFTLVLTLAGMPPPY